LGGWKGGAEGGVLNCGRGKTGAEGEVEGGEGEGGRGRGGGEEA